MISLIEATLTIGRWIVSIVVALFEALYWMQFLFDTAFGLRWVFSSSFRKSIREEKDSQTKQTLQFSIGGGLFLLILLLGLGLYSAVLFFSSH